MYNPFFYLITFQTIYHISHFLDNPWTTFSPSWTSYTPRTPCIKTYIIPFVPLCHSLHSSYLLYRHTPYKPCTILLSIIPLIHLPCICISKDDYLPPNFNVFDLLQYLLTINSKQSYHNYYSWILSRNWCKNIHQTCCYSDRSCVSCKLHLHRGQYLYKTAT